MKIKIYGFGWVGRAMAKLFPDAAIVDPAYPYYREPADACDVAFVCVPTPNRSDGSLDCGLVARVIRESCEPLIVIRSTVQPEFCDRMKIDTGRHLVYQPEYLGESTGHPFSDMAARGFMVLGGEPEDRRQVIELYSTVYNANIKIRQVSLLEAEIIKLSENRAIGMKIAQCQELYDLCERAGVDYYTVREAVYSDDPRFNLWHTFVYKDKRGFNSKCLPKDIIAWNAYAESLGMDPIFTKALIAYNDTLIREQVTS